MAISMVIMGTVTMITTTAMKVMITHTSMRTPKLIRATACPAMSTRSHPTA